MNNVNLIGRLTKAPELKQTASNTNVLTGTLAETNHFSSERLARRRFENEYRGVRDERN